MEKNAQAAPETVSLPTDLWETWLHRKVNNLAKAGRGSGLKKKLKVELNPCPKSLFFALIRPLLRHGRTLQCVDTLVNKRRSLEETNWNVLEEFCSFEDLGGWRNCVINAAKGETFYNVIVGLSFTWTERSGRNEEFLSVEATVVSLNPLATIALPPPKKPAKSRKPPTSKQPAASPTDGDVGGGSATAITNYVRGFPARLNKDGYTVDKRLRTICKQHAKQQLLALQQPSGMCFICNPSHHPSHNWLHACSCLLLLLLSRLARHHPQAAYARCLPHRASSARRAPRSPRGLRGMCPAGPAKAGSSRSNREESTVPTPYRYFFSF